jgi:hypothetical protein
MSDKEYKRNERAKSVISDLNTMTGGIKELQSLQELIDIYMDWNIKVPYDRATEYAFFSENKQDIEIILKCIEEGLAKDRVFYGDWDIRSMEDIEEEARHCNRVLVPNCDRNRYCTRQGGECLLDRVKFNGDQVEYVIENINVIRELLVGYLSGSTTGVSNSSLFPLTNGVDLVKDRLIEIMENSLIITEHITVGGVVTDGRVVGGLQLPSISLMGVPSVVKSVVKYIRDNYGDRIAIVSDPYGLFPENRALTSITLCTKIALNNLSGTYYLTDEDVRYVFTDGFFIDIAKACLEGAPASLDEICKRHNEEKMEKREVTKKRPREEDRREKVVERKKERSPDATERRYRERERLPDAIDDAVEDCDKD